MKIRRRDATCVRSSSHCWPTQCSAGFAESRDAKSLLPFWRGPVPSIFGSAVQLSARTSPAPTVGPIQCL